MDLLVGYSGFVGSNLCFQHDFEGKYNSMNIEQSFQTKPEICIYAGIRAEKFMANKDPEGDMAVIKNAIGNIKRIAPKRLVLISTIDVFMNPNGCDENSPIDTNGLHAYGYNRYYLEQWCMENIQNCHIIRLPALFGRNIKKNFIYDLIHFLPSMLDEAKFKELSCRDSLIAQYYIRQKNGFYKCTCDNGRERQKLRMVFEQIGFSALNFTDSRSIYQFYNLAYLWKHIEIVLQHNIPLMHIAVEPVSAEQVYDAVKGGEFHNLIAPNSVAYDFRTKYEKYFGGKNGYIFGKQKVLDDIVEFIKEGQELWNT